MNRSKNHLRIGIFIVVAALLLPLVLGAPWDGVVDLMRGFDFGKSSLQSIQQDYLTVPRLANYLIFGFVLYVIGMLLPATKDWLRGSAGVSKSAIIVVLILSIFITTNFVIDPQTYVWDEPWYIQGKMMLLGDSNCKADLSLDASTNAVGRFFTVTGGVVDYCYTQASLHSGYQSSTTVDTNEIVGWGILRGSRPFVLIGAFLLIWLFLKVFGQGIDQSLGVNPERAGIFTPQNIIAAIFAIQVANSGTPKLGFLQFAYWLFLFLLYKLFMIGKTKSPENGISRVLACGLTYMIVNTIANIGLGGLKVGPGFVLPFSTLGFGQATAVNPIANLITGLAIGWLWDLIAKMWHGEEAKKAKGILGWWQNHKKKTEEISEKYDKLQKLKNGFAKLPDVRKKLKGFYIHLDHVLHEFRGTQKEREEIILIMAEIEAFEKNMQGYYKKVEEFMHSSNAESESSGGGHKESAHAEESSPPHDEHHA